MKQEEASQWSALGKMPQKKTTATSPPVPGRDGGAGDTLDGARGKNRRVVVLSVVAQGVAVTRGSNPKAR